MLKIPETSYREIHPLYERFMTSARHLLQNGELLSLEIKKTEKNQLLALAKFNGSEYIEVQLLLEANGEILDSWTIPNYTYKEYAYKMATVLKINKSRIKKFPYLYENPSYLAYLEDLRKEEERRLQAAIIRKGKESLNLIDRYKGHLNDELAELIAPKKYRLVTLLHLDENDLYLKFKVGDESLYTLKNIPQFLRHLDHQIYHDYGKKLAFKHKITSFTESSQSVIAFMRKIYNLDNSYYVNELDIPKNLIDEFFNLYEHIPANERDFQLFTEDYKPIINVTEQANHYKLTLDLPDNFVIGTKHLYQLENHQLLKTPLDELNKAADFMRELTREDHLYLPKDHWNDFYYYVLSDIKTYFYLDETNLEPLQISEESKITLYGDIDDNEMIRFHMEYLYENGSKLKSFDPQNHALSLNARKLENYLSTRGKVKDHIAYFDSNNPEAIEFIQQGIPYFQSFCDIYISEALKQIGKKSTMKFSIGVSIKNDLLALDIESVNVPKEELSAILGAYKRKKKFYRLKNGEQIYLDSDGLDEMDKLLTSYGVGAKDIENGQVELDLHRAFAIDHLAQEDNALIQVQRSELFQNMIKRFSNVKDKTFPISESSEKILRDYQKTGYQWLRTLGSYGFGGILADDMGLGKTLQVITLMQETQDKKNTNLVICPASLILNWEEEIKKFAPDLKAATVYGQPEHREELLKNWKDYDVLITSYDYIRRDVDLYKKHKFHLIVIDEAQAIKNPKTKGAQSVKKLKGKHKLALTGTPIENSLAELWSIFDFLMPGYLYPYGYFQKEYESPIVKEKNPEKQNALKRLITPFILRRTKKEVLTELPDKVENILPIEFSEEENKLYLANLMQAVNELQEKPDGEPLNKIAILAMLTRLRQICIEPRLVFENIDVPSSKLQTCIELIKTFKENNQKVLLFSSFTSVFDLLQEELLKEGISFYTLTGQTPKEKRRDLVQNFQNNDTDLFMISLKAGGTGLNLTAAEAVIHFDPWWNISAQNQATDRAYRMGQKNMVQVFKLIMKNSIEEKIIELQEKKKHLSDTFVEGNDGALTTMSTDDLVELLTMA